MENKSYEYKFCIVQDSIILVFENSPYANKSKITLNHTKNFINSNNRWIIIR